MNQKFDKLLAEYLSRYESYGFTPGDRVTLKKDALSHPYFKNCDKRYIDTLKQCLDKDFGYNIFVASQPTTIDIVYGMDSEPVCTVRVEYAPGSSAGTHIRVPCAVLEYQDDGVNQAPIPSKLKRKNNDTKELDVKTKSTANFDVNLINKNKELPYGQKWNDNKPGSGNLTNMPGNKNI
jgi:hypothetical protein